MLQICVSLVGRGLKINQYSLATEVICVKPALLAFRVTHGLLGMA